MVFTLDLTDRKILSELDKNARTSYSELGKRIRVAKETVKYRVKRLQDEGILQGFYTVVNLSKLGFVLHRLYLRLQNTSPITEHEIENYLINSKNVAVFYRINGEYNIVLGVWARTNWEYDEFWNSFKEKFGQYFAKYHLSIMTEYIEFSRLYLLNGSEDKTQFITITRTEKEKLDAIDFALLAYLSNNARASLVDIAKKLRISIVTARYHLKKLCDKKVIVGFRPIFNLQALEREYYKVDIWFKKFDNVKKAAENILSNPNVVYTEKTLATSDLEFDVEVENFSKFIEMMDVFRETYPEDIREYKYYSRVKHHKTSYIPEI
ncbi:MAG: Lrp/AsnC family transcriptional regulator [Candidatus Micrarchaeota archaeon]